MNTHEEVLGITAIRGKQVPPPPIEVQIPGLIAEQLQREIFALTFSQTTHPALWAFWYQLRAANTGK